MKTNRYFLTNLFIAIVACLAFVGSANADPGVSFWAMDVGNYWVFNGSNPSCLPTPCTWTWRSKVVALDTTTVPGVTTYYLEGSDEYDGFVSQKNWYSISQTEMRQWRIEFQDDDPPVWHTVIIDGGFREVVNPIVSSWTDIGTGTWDGIPFNATVQSDLEGYANVSVPLGTYKAYQIHRVITIPELGGVVENRTFWFVPYIGVIKDVYDNGGGDISTEVISSISTYIDTVQKIFIGYYQRPADPEGLLYWVAKLDARAGNLNEIIAAFANSAESQALYGTINSSNISTVVTNIYSALFGRSPDTAGLNYYVNGFNSGQFTAATIMLNVLNGAQNEDLLSVNNKLTAANLFTKTIDPELDGTDFQATYSGNADAQKARDFLSTITFNPVTIPTQAEATAYIQDNIADSGDPILMATATLEFPFSNRKRIDKPDRRMIQRQICHQVCGLRFPDLVDDTNYLLSALRYAPCSLL